LQDLHEIKPATQNIKKSIFNDALYVVRHCLLKINRMRTFSLIALFLFIHFGLSGQEIRGRITDAKTNKPLEYVSIGIVNTNIGTITDKNGQFKLEAIDEDQLIVRISMIGYEPQKFTVEELRNMKNEIKLDRAAIELAEVLIKPKSERKVGATSFNRSSGWSGWGGKRTKRGYEVGIILDLGNNPIKVKNLNFLLKRQSFDTTLFRLHIRAIMDTILSNELLSKNIIFPVTQESGWVEIDLEAHNIVLSGKVGVTLEWLDVKGNNPDRAMKINKRMAEAYVLFKNKKNQFGLFRWGTESKWKINKKFSPSMYLTILEYKPHCP
jgi:CarboxypepD_reg-like domain